MKRTVKDRKEYSIRQSNQGNCMRQLPNTRAFFRSQSESNLRQSVPMPLAQGNCQIAGSPMVSVVGVPTRPLMAGINPGRTRSSYPLQVNRNFPVPFYNRILKSMTTNPPRYLSWRSPVKFDGIPSTLQRFQEPRRSLGWAYQRFGSRVGHGAKRGRNSMIRQWDMLPEGNFPSSEDFWFTVVSYNLLSDRLLFENKFLYEGCNQEVLNWEFRRENLLRELLGYNADILCLQEVDADHYRDWFEPKLSQAGYTGVYNQRTGGKPDGCVTFYRNSKFKLVKKKLVKYYTRNVPVLDKDNVGVVVLLQAQTVKPQTQTSKSDKDTRKLCVANTHLLFNKKRGDIKLAQLAYLFAEVDSLAMLSNDDHDAVYCPVILCGDLNSLPYSPLHHFLTKGHLEYSTRSPSVISGQLSPSECAGGQGKRSIDSPLLPWHCGITLECQWRNPKGPQEQDGGCDPAINGTEVDNSSDVGKTEHEKTTVIAIPFQFASVYKHHLEDGTPEVTTCHSKACCNVDYIFYTTGVREGQAKNKKYTQKGRLSLLGKLELLGKSDFNLVKRLPTRQFSSDHLSLMALFKLT